MDKIVDVVSEASVSEDFGVWVDSAEFDLFDFEAYLSTLKTTITEESDYFKDGVFWKSPFECMSALSTSAAKQELLKDFASQYREHIGIPLSSLHSESRTSATQWLKLLAMTSVSPRR